MNDSLWNVVSLFCRVKWPRPVRRCLWEERTDWSGNVLPNSHFGDTRSVNIRYHRDTRRLEFMQSRLKFANLLSQHYHINASHHLLLALLLCRPSLLNLQRYKVSFRPPKKWVITRRQTLSDLVCFIRIINSKSVHESTAAHFEFRLLRCREFRVGFLDSGSYKVRLCRFEEDTFSVFTTAYFEELFDVLDLFRHFDPESQYIQHTSEEDCIPFEVIPGTLWRIGGETKSGEAVTKKPCFLKPWTFYKSHFAT